MGIAREGLTYCMVSAMGDGESERRRDVPATQDLKGKSQPLPLSVPLSLCFQVARDFGVFDLGF